MISDGLINEVQRIHAVWWGDITPELAAAIGRKVAEEGLELGFACLVGDGVDIHHEIGDVLFAVLAACRIVPTDPESALKSALERNRSRWS